MHLQLTALQENLENSSSYNKSLITTHRPQRLIFAGFTFFVYMFCLYKFFKGLKKANGTDEFGWLISAIDK